MPDVKYVVDGDNSVLKSALFDAYNGQCWWCSKPILFWSAQIDHLLPKTAPPERIKELAKELDLDERFDVHDPRNLGPICPGCNLEKSSTDYTKSDRILTKLRKAERLRPKVIRLVRTFADSGPLASALLRAKEVDLSDPDALRTLQQLGPGFLQSLANVEGFVIDYTSYQRVEAGDGEESVPVVVTLDADGRRALVLLEDACGADLEVVLTVPVAQLEALVSSDVKDMFEGIEVSGGSSYSGPASASIFDVEVTTISVTRTGTYFEFSFGGSVEAHLTASLMQDDADPGTLEEVQGEASVAGEFYFTIDWDPSGSAELDVTDVGVNYSLEEIWTE